jgi:hypothetical protein
MAPTESAISRKRLKSRTAGISAAARDDHLRLVLGGEARHVRSKSMRSAFPAPSGYLVAHHVVGLARKIQLVAVREVAAVSQIEPMMVSPG